MEGRGASLGSSSWRVGIAEMLAHAERKPGTGLRH
jgi:hypothetical protein